MNADDRFPVRFVKYRWRLVGLWLGLTVVCLVAMLAAERFPSGSLAYEILFRIPIVYPGLLAIGFILGSSNLKAWSASDRVSFAMFAVGIFLTCLGIDGGPHMSNTARAGFVLMAGSIAYGGYAGRHLIRASQQSTTRASSNAAWLGLIGGGLLLVSGGLSFFSATEHSSRDHGIAGILLGAALLCSSVGAFVSNPMTRIVKTASWALAIAGLLLIW